MTEEPQAQQVSKSINYQQILLAIGLIILTALPFFLAPLIININHPFLAFDWRNSYHGAIWLDNFGWDTRFFRMPPYAMPYFLPITALSFEIGWSLMTYITVVGILLSIPRNLKRVIWISATLLLFTSYYTMRNLADLNVEGFVILGLALSQFAFRQKHPTLLAIAVLIAAIKPQENFLFMAVLGIYLLQEFTWRDNLKFGAIVIGEVVISMLLWGAAWLPNLNLGRTGMSLREAFPLLGMPEAFVPFIQIAFALVTITICLSGKRDLSHIKVGFLVVGSLLAAPYINGLSLTTVLAFAVVGIFIKRPWLGILLFIAYNHPYLGIFGFNFNPMADSLAITFLLIPTWFILGFELYQEIREANALSFTHKTTIDT